MDKKEYIVNQFRKTYNKKYENYCITRIYHRLNRLDLKIVTQQLFRRNNKKIALADLYFPQLNLYVEIDENHHLNQKEADLKRKEEISKYDKIIRKKIKNLEEIITEQIEEIRIKVDYKMSMEDINNQIEDVVNIIEEKIYKMGNDFVPWILINNSSDYCIKNGYIDSNENIRFKTIDNIGELFNIKVPFNQKLHAFFNITDNTFVWCPILKLNGDECEKINCDNEIDGIYIYETSKKNNNEFVKEVLNKEQKRYIFAKYMDESGVLSYKFKGIYILDKELTVQKNKRVWKKVEDILYL